jgi:hypothetical protein
MHVFVNKLMQVTSSVLLQQLTFILYLILSSVSPTPYNNILL